jgi:O-antigen ligase
MDQLPARERRVAPSAAIGFAVLALAWLVPNHYPPWTSFHNESLAAAALVILAASAVVATPSTAPPRLAWAILLLSSVPWLQWLAGKLWFTGDAWVSTLYLVGAAVAVSTAFRWAHRDATAVAVGLCWSALAAALVSGAIAVVQASHFGPVGVWTAEMPAGVRPGANLAQSNNLATLIGFGLVGILWLHERARLRANAALLLTLCLIATLSLTQSRVSLLFGPVLIAGVWLGRRRGAIVRTGLRTTCLLVAIAWIALWLEPRFVGDSLLPTQSVEGRGVQSLRFTVWPMLWSASLLHPWSGYGWMQAGSAQLAVADAYPPVGEVYLYAHNLFLELVLWCGYPAAIAIGGILVCWFLDRWKRVVRLEALAGMLVVTIVGVHAMSEFPYQYAYFLIPMGLWAGLVEADVAPRGWGLPWGHGALLAGGALLLVAIWKDYPAVEDDFRVVRFQSMKIGAQALPASTPEAPFLSGLTSFLSFSRTVPTVGMTLQDLEKMRKVIERYPFASPMARYANALALNGRSDEAMRMYRKILAIHGETLYRKVRAELRTAGESTSALAELENRLSELESSP